MKVKQVAIDLYTIILYPIFKTIFPFPKIFSKDESLRIILENPKSVVRFGDGELHLISETEDVGFQKRNLELSKRLKAILKSYSEDDFYLCLPDQLYSLKNHNFQSRMYWQRFIVFHYKRYIQLFNFKKQYLSANITRPYFDIIKKENIDKYFNDFKKLWFNKRVLIVEGEQSKIGVNNDLLDGAVIVNRVVTLSKEAFSVYGTIYTYILSVANDFDLVLIALGPTATVLAYDLGKKDIISIDIGHLDIEYEWFLQGAKTKVNIPGKYVNEAMSITNNFEDATDVNSTYKKQIIKYILK